MTRPLSHESLTPDGAGIEWRMTPTDLIDGKGRDMKLALFGRAVAVLAWLIIVTLFAGCRQTPDRRQARLLAAENTELNERLADQKAETQALLQEQIEELAQCQEELAQCAQRNEQLQGEIQKGIAQRVGDVTAKVMDENAKLRKEIKDLRTEVERLKARLQPPDSSPDDR